MSITSLTNVPPLCMTSTSWETALIVSSPESRHRPHLLFKVSVLFQKTAELPDLGTLNTNITFFPYRVDVTWTLYKK